MIARSGSGQSGAFSLFSSLLLAFPLLFPLRHLRGASSETDLPAVSINGPAYQLPLAEEPRQVYRFGGNVPAPVAAFWEQNGSDWKVYWDDLLQTPRSLFPQARWLIAPPEAVGAEPDRAELTRSVLDFIDDNAPFFGARSADLTEPYIYPVGGAWVLVFGQAAPSGIAVRGANIRVVVRDDGHLGYVKSFLLRSPPAGHEALADGAALASLLAGAGVAVREARLELGFPDEANPGIAFPIWSFDAVDPDGHASEYIADARDGSLLARRRVMKFFDAQGTVRARVQKVDAQGNPFSTVEPLPHCVLREKKADGSLTIVDVSGDDGRFLTLVEQDPAELVASLEYGACNVGDPECLPTPDPPQGITFFHRIVNIEPRLCPDAFADPSPECRLAEGIDLTSDFVPDVAVRHEIAFEFDPIFNELVSDRDELEFRSLWITAFRETVNPMRFMEKVLNTFGLERPEFTPIRCIEVQPFPLGNDAQFCYVALPGVNPCSVLHIAPRILSFHVAGGDGPPSEPTPPTFVTHEAGHHIIFNMTGAQNTMFAEIEEGIADALVGMVRASPEVGFLENGRPTSRAFTLGRLNDSFRTFDRQLIGNAFWRLHNELRQPPRRPENQLEQREDTFGAGILFHWLGLNRTKREHAWIGTRGHDLLDEILFVDDSPAFGGDSNPADGSPHDVLIRDIFGPVFADEPFKRGDANLDSQVNITDALVILNYLFAGLGPFHRCLNALDANNRGRIDISDAIFLLNFLFLGAAAIPPPFPDCGLETEPRWKPENLGCFETRCPK